MICCQFQLISNCMQSAQPLLRQRAAALGFQAQGNMCEERCEGFEALEPTLRSPCSCGCRLLKTPHLARVSDKRAASTAAKC